jgi:hypothetical protein
MLPVTRSGNAMSDMAQVMTRVRKMSDSQLADILSGKDVSIPQFAAMAEAMGRRQLRDAVKGAQAQQQAQQPSVKDQLLMADAQEAGLAALPAPNMDSVDMASGGIVAFEDGGEVPGFYKGGDPWAEQRAREEDPNVFMSKAWFKKNFEGAGGISGSAAAKKKADIEAQQLLNAKEKPEFGEPILRTDEDPEGKANARSIEELVRQQNERGPGVSEPPITPAAPAAKPPKSAIDISAPTKFERRASPFGEMSAEKVDFEGLKDKGFGEGLMRLGAGLLSAPGAKGLGAGVAALAEQAGLTRKEIAGLKKDARDYDLNLKRAEEAFNQGQDELGYKYMSEANANKYRMGMLNKPSAQVELLQALGDPELMKRFQAMSLAKKPTETVPRDKALTAWGKLSPKEKRDYVDFETYYNTINNKLLTDTIGSGADVLGKV